MSETTNPTIFPKSPSEVINDIPYFMRMCDKIRLHAKGQLHADYHPNLGGGFDLWTCDYLRVSYQDLVEKVKSGLSDEAVLEWAKETGGERTAAETDWWLSYMRNRGFNDDLSEILDLRKSEGGFEGRDDVVNFFGLIDADEGRS